MSNINYNIIPQIRPRGTTLTQHNAPNWRNKVEKVKVSPILLILGLILIAIGLVLFNVTMKNKEIIIDYTHCKNAEDQLFSCADIIENNYNEECTCSLNFTMDRLMEAPIYFYYGLNNFYQNQRGYVISRDDAQLSGNLVEKLSSNCAPYDYVLENGKKMPTAPCGAIANSMFNDSLTLSLIVDNDEVTIPVFRTGICWPSDKRIKFQNPPGNLQTVLENFTKPVNWRKPIWELDTEDSDNNGFHNEDLIVWMRTATLPNFRKLYRKVDHDGLDLIRTGLPAGNYLLNITYTYPVKSFKGTKSFIIANTSMMGVTNGFLFILSFASGCLLLLCAVFLYIVQIRYEED